MDDKHDFVPEVEYYFTIYNFVYISFQIEVVNITTTFDNCHYFF